mmetsp:Transcript_25956/g.29530  ORF Transcript_25956/g.29530 Transcript_25956/m.29530 type:complete len:611 (-) Transcript_25956:533-2365(-)
MKFSLSSFLFTALLVPSTEVKGACTWALNKGTGISGGFAGGTVAQQFSTVELAQAKCVELGMLVCKAVSCTPSACSVYTGDTLAMVDYDATSYLPSADCVALADRWNIGNVTASNAGSEFSFQYAEMSRLWLGTFAGGENTGEKITATIYGEFCMVDEFLDTCNWTVESGNKIAPGDPALKESYADGYMFPLTLVEAQVKCLDLGDSLCNAVTCLSDDNGLCTVRFYDSALSFEAGAPGDTSYGLPSNHNTADCALKPSAKEESYTFPRPFSDPSITWTNTEIIESVDSKGDTVFTPTPGDALFLQYTVSGDPKGMAASEIPDPEYGTSPELKFCVRLGLYADTCADTCATCANPDPTCVVSEEINFFESVVTVTISFDGNFEVLGIGVAPKEQGQTSAAVVYTASAELCGATAEAGNGGKTATEYGQAVKVDNNFNQGAAIMVCISLDKDAKDAEVEINKIKSFIWTQETAGSTPKTQVGIDADGLAGNGLTIQSPIQNSPVGTENVIVTSVLFAAFYEEVGSVKASGEVEMSFARRRRLGTTDNRRLQEADPIAAFDVDATLNKADDGPVAIQQTAGGNGGTYSISNVVGVAITSIVGLLVSDSVLFA